VQVERHEDTVRVEHIVGEGRTLADATRVAAFSSCASRGRVIEDPSRLSNPVA
jgi:hypothetical protein